MSGTDFRVHPVRAVILLGAVLFATAGPAPAQTVAREPLPSAGEVLDRYFAASGGRERVAAVRDGSFEWRIESGGVERGVALSRRMAPASLREEFPNGPANVATPEVAWRRRPNGAIVVDTGAVAARARLQAALEASYFMNLDALGITARVVGADSAYGEPAYRVEFSRPDGAMRTWLFSARSHLPLQLVIDPARGMVIRYEDYRPVDGVLEPHRVVIGADARNAAVFILTSAKHNVGLTGDLFLPPGAETPGSRR